ncbi:hypothetical protein [Halorubrum sp. GN11GM_10-3_MGM]|uniref:hypothetical protein n=1 Tax=Halorubrum sp. GN11GM_10-3_MGM TaxID=2518111 RepID=UPI0010F9EAD1|nr:hypothetical protein [Halorubrum sp. GN11GM_10-3_MGM]TKX70957.1 hypothetical protein EXE40_08655 [Halorubrum sp. GN11GM_10-3_MGM]
MIDAAAEWAAGAGPPNWMFALALLTHPKVWSEAAVRIVRARVLDDGADGGDPADGEVQA